MAAPRAYLSGGSVLSDKAHEGEHGKTAVLDLLQLVLLQDLCVHKFLPSQCIVCQAQNHIKASDLAVPHAVFMARPE